jgi:hypothetical protein
MIRLLPWYEAPEAGQLSAAVVAATDAITSRARTRWPA